MPKDHEALEDVIADTECTTFFNVRRMHHHYGIAYQGEPRFLNKEEREFRLKAMLEELDEYRDAETLEEELDALVDLIIFALGTIDRQGLPFTHAFDVVIKANMQKQLGPNTGKDRGEFRLDLVKPLGWKAPDLAPIIQRRIEDVKTCQS